MQQTCCYIRQITTSGAYSMNKKIRNQYINAQIDGLNHSKISHSLCLKLHSVAGETNWINVTPEQIEAIRAILTETNKSK